MFKVALALALLGSVASADPLTMSVGVRDATYFVGRTPVDDSQHGAAVGLDGPASPHWSWRVQVMFDDVSMQPRGEDPGFRGYKVAGIFGYRLDAIPRASAFPLRPYLAQGIGVACFSSQAIVAGTTLMLDAAELGVDYSIGAGMTVRVDAAVEATEREVIDVALVAGVSIAGRID